LYKTASPRLVLQKKITKFDFVPRIIKTKRTGSPGALSDHHCRCGGSNGVRVRLWKRGLQHFANETGLLITVTHLPPGTSKWNRIEHRLFAYIAQNRRGKPLVSHR
jgi:hypothetical protein